MEKLSKLAQVMWQVVELEFDSSCDAKAQKQNNPAALAVKVG